MLCAASEVLGVGGVEGFNVEDVVRRSGVAKSTIYRHFSSSDELLCAALGCMLVPLPTPNTGDLRDDLRMFCRQALDFLDDENTSVLMLGVASRAATDPDFADIHKQYVEQARLPMKTVIQLAQARGDVHPGLDITLAVDILEGPFMIHKLVRREPMTLEQAFTIIELAATALENFDPAKLPALD